MGGMRYFIIIGFLLIQLTGCNDQNNSGLEPSALVEMDFVINHGLMADPSEKVVYIELEHEKAEESTNLTGELGFDIIPFSYSEPVNQTFCWEDPNEEAGHVMSFMNDDGLELASISANGECATITIEPGSYEMHLFHDNNSGFIHPIFIQPNVLENVVARVKPIKVTQKPVGFLNRILKILSQFDLSNTTLAQSTPTTPEELANVTKLINTAICMGCDLRNTILDSNINNCGGEDASDPLNLINADMTGATISGMVACGGMFADAKFVNSTITNLSSFFGALFGDADFSNAIINNSTFLAASLGGALFDHATITNVNFSKTDMTNSVDTGNSVNFGFAVVEDSDFREVFGIKNAVFVNSTFENCDFSGLDLTQDNLFSTTDLSGSNLSMTNLSNIFMVDTIFNNVILENSDLSGFTCINCSFSGANLTNASVSGASFDSTGAIWTDGSCTCQDENCSNCT